MPLKLKRDNKTGIYQIAGRQVVPGQRLGVLIRESTRTTDRREAERYLEAVRKRLIDGAELGPAATYTLADAIDYYLEKGGEGQFLMPILEKFGHVRVSELGDTDVSRFATDRFGHLAASSVKRVYYTPLNAVINKSAEKGLCPLRRFEPPRVVREPARWASEAWWQAFRPHANFNTLAISLFMMTTSARVTEALNLIPIDVDLEARTALLRKTKNGKARMVYLSPLMVRIIIRMIRSRQVRPHDRIFLYSHRRNVNQALERAAKRAGIEYLSSHEIGRHTFAARFLAAGYSLKALQEAGGWATIQIVAETYGHLERSHVEGAVRDVGSRIGFSRKPQVAIPEKSKPCAIEGGSNTVEEAQLIDFTGGR